MQFAEWRDVLQFLITVITGLIGVPVIQAFKNYLHLENKPAIILTVFVSVGLALLEVWLSCQVNFFNITPANFPEFFGLIFAVATVYYHLLKDNSGVLGRKFMIRQA
jgi:uncharacterized protein (DUF486 family)